MATTKILVSGLTGRIGQAMMQQLPKVPDIEIVAGMKRDFFGKDDFLLCGDLFDGVEWLYYDAPMLLEADNLIDRAKQVGANAIVDVSHPSVFCKVVELAVRLELPLISITSGLSGRQMAMLYDVINHIPVFRSYNVSFCAKQLLDDCEASFANFEHEKSFHDDTEFAEIESSAAGKYPYIAQDIDSMLHGQEIVRDIALVFGCKMTAPELYARWPAANIRRISRKEKISDAECLDNIARDILQITKIMANKPVKTNRPYNLDELWDELMPYATWRY